MSTLGSPSSVFYLNGDGSIQEFKAGAQPGITFHYPRKSYCQIISGHLGVIRWWES